MAESIRNALPAITSVLFGLALLLFLISWRFFKRSRTNAFWRKRRDAGQRGWRVFVVGFGLFSCSGFFCAFSVVSALFIEEENPAPATGTTTQVSMLTSPAPQQTPEATATLLPLVANATQTPEVTPKPVTQIVIVTATPVSTPTETPFPTFTPPFTPEATYVTPLPEASIWITALDDQISDDLTPVNPRTSFVAGTIRVYFFVEFEAMTQGVKWTRALYRNGELIDGSNYRWGLEENGTSYFFFGNDSGFEPGLYEIRLFIGDTDVPESIMPFSVVQPSE